MRTLASIIILLVEEFDDNVIIFIILNNCWYIVQLHLMKISLTINFQYFVFGLGRQWENKEISDGNNYIKSVKIYIVTTYCGHSFLCDHRSSGNRQQMWRQELCDIFHGWRIRIRIGHPAFRINDAPTVEHHLDTIEQSRVTFVILNFI